MTNKLDHMPMNAELTVVAQQVKNVYDPKPELDKMLQSDSVKTAVADYFFKEVTIDKRGAAHCKYITGDRTLDRFEVSEILIEISDENGGNLREIRSHYTKKYFADVCYAVFRRHFILDRFDNIVGLNEKRYVALGYKPEITVE